MESNNDQFCSAETYLKPMIIWFRLLGVQLSWPGSLSKTINVSVWTLGLVTFAFNLATGWTYFALQWLIKRTDVVNTEATEASNMILVFARCSIRSISHACCLYLAGQPFLNVRESTKHLLVPKKSTILLQSILFFVLIAVYYSKTGFFKINF